MSDPSPASEPSPSGARDSAFERLLGQVLERLDAESGPDLETLLAAHPDQAARLREQVDLLRRMGLLGPGRHGHPERLGDFRIVAPLGQGGMGVVYRAVQESLGREVALKLIRPDQLFFPGARERFTREVTLVARMQHPGIVPVFAVGEAAGLPYFAMELVRGATLADLVGRLRQRRPKDLDGRDLDRAIAAALGESADTPPSAMFRASWTDVVLRIVREVAEALEHAHRRGVLHRDVKPSNIMVTREGRVLLLDFGLAGAEQVQRITRTGSALGSWPYMSPEMLAGGAAGNDERTDVYSLGATCWELLALRLPYQDTDPVRLRELAGTAARPKLATLNPSVSWDVETVVATALEPNPTRRYASARLFANDLDHLLAHRPITARKAGPALRLRRWSQRHPALATAAAAAVLLVVGAPSAWAWQEAGARARIEAQRDELAQVNRALDAAMADAET
jgi:serine/threonine protein kinase